jgi:hypothetical protein
VGKGSGGPVNAVLSKKEIISDLSAHIKQLKPRDRQNAEVISTGFPEVDRITGGIPRGCITEIAGALSAGRTSLMLSTLSEATNNDEICALVDATDSLDIHSASQFGIDLDRLLWVRCAGNIEHAFKSIDFILQGGGFGLVALDIADIPVSDTTRIVSSWWYRFRRAVEDTRTALVIIGQQSCARSAATMMLKLDKEQSIWTSASSLLNRKPPPTHTISSLLSGTRLHVERQKPIYLSEQNCKVVILNS